MSTDQVATDLRQYPRVSADCKVDYEVVQQEGRGEMETGFAVNISGGGLCFTSQEQLPMGAMVALKVRMPQMPSPIVALARVMWTRPQQGSGLFENGVEFWWLGWGDSSAQDAMLDYVNEKLQSGE